MFTCALVTSYYSALGVNNFFILIHWLLWLLRCYLFIPFYMQVSGLPLVYGLHSDSVSYDIGVADCNTGSAAVSLRLS